MNGTRKQMRESKMATLSLAPRSPTDQKTLDANDEYQILAKVRKIKQITDQISSLMLSRSKSNHFKQKMETLLATVTSDISRVNTTSRPPK